MPSVSPLRHLPCLLIIYTPLDTHRSDTITLPDRPPADNDNDLTPRPLYIKKVKKWPSIPFSKGGRGRQEGKEDDRKSNKGFLGMNFPPSPKTRSSSAGELAKDKDKAKPDGDGDFNGAQNHPGAKGGGSSPTGARMAWLQGPAERQRASVSNHGNEADPHLRESFVQMEPNNLEEHELHDSSSQTGEDAGLPRYSDDQSSGDKHRKNTVLGRVATASTIYDKSARRGLV